MVVKRFLGLGPVSRRRLRGANSPAPPPPPCPASHSSSSSSGGDGGGVDPSTQDQGHFFQGSRACAGGVSRGPIVRAPCPSRRASLLQGPKLLPRPIATKQHFDVTDVMVSSLSHCPPLALPARPPPCLLLPLLPANAATRSKSAANLEQARQAMQAGMPAPGAVVPSKNEVYSKRTRRGACGASRSAAY